MSPIGKNLSLVRERIAAAAEKAGRPARDVELLAVSKTRPAEDVLEAFQQGQQGFGESYIQEAVDKIRQLSQYPIQWHFIGRIQSNKTRLIAEHFDWVHSITSEKQLRRLDQQRPEHLEPLRICLQIKLNEEESKAGIDLSQAAELLACADALPNIQPMGLMTLPAPALDFDTQRKPFAQLRQLRDRLKSAAMPLPTLSMGMSDDLEAAIAEGATIVRIGTAVFGPRLAPHTE
jgi:pyridoxal phosphate enzyme (YggS family)